MNVLDEKRNDAKEFVKLLEKIPEKRKQEVLGILKGFTLCAESEAEEKKTG